MDRGRMCVGVRGTEVPGCIRAVPSGRYVCGHLAFPGLLYHQINQSRWEHCHAPPDFGALFLCLATKYRYTQLTP